MNITEFLEARISEDEDAARGAEPGPWYVDSDEQTVRAREHAGTIMYDRSGECRSEWAENFRPDAEHIARYDPLRVLAECAAKRAIIRDRNYAAIHDLAAIYQEHPDYRPEWARNAD